MSAEQGLYALIQFSPRPERLEFLNVGVLLAVPDLAFFRVRLANTSRRLERAFGRLSQAQLHDLKASFASRLELEFSGSFNRERFEWFARSRANDMRVSKLQSVAVSDPASDLEALFVSLVGEDEKPSRKPTAAAKLKREFEHAGVSLLVEHPSPVELPQGVVVSAPYAYQNGAYNLIDPIRLSGDTGLALKEASKRAIEGQWLRSFSASSGSRKELVVVGDFEGQPIGFYDAIRDMMREHRVKLYRLDTVEPLIDDIRDNARPYIST